MDGTDKLTDEQCAEIWDAVDITTPCDGETAIFAAMRAAYAAGLAAGAVARVARACVIDEASEANISAADILAQDLGQDMAHWLHKWPGGAPNEAWSALSALMQAIAAPRAEPPKAEQREPTRELYNRCQNYLASGGLWNPEAMEHDKVRDLIRDVRDYLHTKAER